MKAKIRTKIFCLVVLSSLAFTQTQAQFPSTDSLRKFINTWIRNSTIDAFTNLRLNTSLIGMTSWVDSAKKANANPMDTTYAQNDSTMLFKSGARTWTAKIRGNAGGTGSTNLGSVQNATTYSLTSTTGSGTTLYPATINVAGLIDTARARWVDSMRQRLWPAGGDLSSTYPNPFVVRVQGVPWSSTVPTTGQVPMYNGTQWVPTASGAAGSTVWGINGNTGLTTANFLGTTDSADLIMKVLGVQVGRINIKGANHATIFGYGASPNMSDQTTAIGRRALSLDNGTNVGNTAIGDSALAKTVNPNLNTAIGAGAMANNNADYYNTAIGYQALYSDSLGGYSNTAIGNQSMVKNKNGNSNTAIGNTSLSNVIGGVVGTGSLNLAIGSGSLPSIKTGSFNIQIGNQTGNLNTDSSLNSNSSSNIIIGNLLDTKMKWQDSSVIIGSKIAPTSIPSSITSKSNNVIIGNGAGRVRAAWDSSGNWNAWAQVLQAPDSANWKVLVQNAAGDVRKMNWLGGGGGGSSYTFTNSIQNTAGTVNLVGDATSPGNSFYYGTNASGTKGFYAIPPGTLKIQGKYLLTTTGKDTAYFDSTKVVSTVDPNNGIKVNTGVAKFWMHDADSTNKQSGANLTWDGTTVNIGSAGTSAPQLTAGTIYAQSYALNNAWFLENMKWNGSFYTRGATGFASGITMYNGSTGLMAMPSLGAGNAGNLVTPVRAFSDGGVSIGGTNINSQTAEPTSAGGAGPSVLITSTNALIGVPMTTAGVLQNFAAKTSAYTATTTDQILTGDATTAAFTITLPTAVSATGQTYTIKKIDASANAVTVGTTSSQTIDGATTYALSARWKYVTVASNGSNWLIIANN